MNRVRCCFMTFVALSSLGACVGAPKPGGDASMQRGGLVIAPEPDKDFDDETAFSRSVTTRYGGLAAASIADDLARHGFSCRDLPPVEARGDYGLQECVRADAFGEACFDTYAVTIRRELGATDRARAEARYARRCLGLNAPKK